MASRRRKATAGSAAPLRGRWREVAVVALFSATLFLSAGLTFLVQPMFAKFVLPLFGSTPAVWNTSMLFFQTTLLGGYLYAHASTRRLGVRRQTLLHLGVLLVPLLVLPIAVPDGWIPPADSNPVPWLLGLLAVAVGLPFFVVSTTAPLLQRWLAATDHPAAADPYFLYRASNLGSVLGLLSYPLIVEPAMRLSEQGRLTELDDIGDTIATKVGELRETGTPVMLAMRIKGGAAASSVENTTLAVVVTDAILTKPQAKRLAMIAQTGFARAIYPVHAPLDGDVLFAAATCEKPIDPLVGLTELGMVAANTVARAIARGVYEAAALPFPGALPAWQDRFGG